MNSLMVDENNIDEPSEPSRMISTPIVVVVPPTSPNVHNNNNNNVNIPKATASMCYYCFDVLFYELYQQQFSSRNNNNNNHSFLFPKSLRSNLNLPTASSSSTSVSTNNTLTFVTLNKPIIQPMIDDLVELECQPHHHTTGTLTTGSIVSTDHSKKHQIQTNIECPLFVTWEKKTKNTKKKPKKTKTLVTKSHPLDPSNHHNMSITTTVAPSHEPDNDNDSIENDDNDDDDNEYELRGCIGSLTSKRIDEHLYHYIRSSAFHDTRFIPLMYHPHSPQSWDEIISLRVSISLLVQYEICQNCYDWTVGQHGIIIKFTAPSTTSSSSSSSLSSYSATFLPEVASQQSWDRTTTIRQLIYKSGYNGTISSSLLQSIHCTRYQSSKCTMTFRQYIKLYQTLQQQQRESSSEMSDNPTNPILRDIISKMNHVTIWNDTSSCDPTTSSSLYNDSDDKLNTTSNHHHHHHHHYPHHPPICNIM